MLGVAFALPTAVAGIALSSLYAPKGWIGWLVSANGPLHLGWKIAYTPAGIVIALIFIGLPFVVRTVQPVLEEMEKELEGLRVRLQEPAKDQAAKPENRDSAAA